ncbi:MAG: DUF2125 domain-containing protein, partial [Rhodobacteraceae bacterium]|nr:DUF2125 domain-containing protein [Paracoccaceae bacterium]
MPAAQLGNLPFRHGKPRVPDQGPVSKDPHGCGCFLAWRHGKLYERQGRRMQRGQGHMRRLIVAICVVAVLWSAWWVVASRFALVAVRQAVAVLGQNELRVSLGDVGVTGFPNRLDLILQDLAVVDAGTGRALRLPKLDLYTLTWNPWHVLFALPGGLSLTGAADTSPLTLMPQTFLASVQVPPFGDMSLSAAQMQADGVVIDHMGAQGHVGHLFAASRQRGDARSHDLWFELKDVTLPEGWVPPASGAQTGTGAALAGNVISGAHLDAAVDFAAP